MCVNDKIVGSEHLRRQLKIQVTYDVNVSKLAEKYGVSVQAMSRFLNGKAEITKKVAEKMGYRRVIMWEKVE